MRMGFWQIGAASTLCQIIFQLIYVLTSSYARDLFVTIERMMSRISVAEISCLQIQGEELYVSQIAWECLSVPQT